MALFLAVLMASCQNISIEDDVLSAPATLSVTVNGTSVELEWAASDGAIGYTVYYARAAETVSAEDHDTAIEAILLNHTTVSGLDAGVTYAFIVVALGSGGTMSSPSPVETAVPDATLSAPIIDIMNSDVGEADSGYYPHRGDRLSVIIEAVAPGDATVVIKYTLDGSEPSRDHGSTIDEDGLSIVSDCTLKAMAYVPTWDSSTDSAVVTKAFDLVDVYALVSDGIEYFVYDSAADQMWESGVSYANDIAVAGGDVYVVGSNSGAMAVYAANGGTAIELTSVHPSSGEAIAVDSSGTVYVAGHKEDKACYWTRTSGGVITEYPLSSNTGSCATSVQVVGGAVYTAGYEVFATPNGYVPDRRACYWIGTSQTLIGDDTGSFASVAAAVAWDGSNVLSAGYNEGEAYLSARYWQGSTIEEELNGAVARDASYRDGAFTLGGRTDGWDAYIWNVVPGATPSVTSLLMTPSAGGDASIEGVHRLADGLVLACGYYDSPTVSQRGAFWIDNADEWYSLGDNYENAVAIYAINE